MQARPYVLAVLGIVAAPAVSFAEVSDKAATIPQDWALAVPIAAILFLAAGLRWWLGVVLAVVPAFMLLGSIDMTFDQCIGPALWREQGWPYFASLWGSDLLMLAALLIGIRRGWARRQVSRKAPAG
jgi:hypothetical protein